MPAEDVTGIAGWMYTDLLLALMIVFLATISFVPQLTGSGQGDGDSLFSVSEVYDTPLTIAYAEPTAAELEQDIEAFAKKQGIIGSAIPIAVRIIGSYDAVEESATDALKRAESARQAIVLENPELFAQASVILGSTTSLPVPQVAIEITFAVERGVTASQYQNNAGD